MNYKLHYEKLVSRAQNRVLQGYSERHHIVPKCMGGSNSKSNLVDLTAEEHYVAHQLLVKIYPEHRGVAAAAVRIKAVGSRKAYGWLRAHLAELMKGNQYAKGLKHGPMPLEKRMHLSSVHKGRKFSPEHLAKMRATKSQRVYRASEETKAKMSAAHIGRKYGPCKPETRAKIGAANKGKSPNAEARAKMSAAAKGRPRTPEWIANWRASMERRKNSAVAPPP